MAIRNGLAKASAVALMPALFVALALLTAGCSSGLNGRDKEERKTFYYPSRQLPGEPVYNRLTYVRPPQVLPERSPSEYKGDVIQPELRLAVENSTLEKTADALASMVGYRSFTAPSIADRPFSCNVNGSLDDIARVIGASADVEAYVDHESRSIRFMPQTAVEPRLLDSADQGSPQR